jgi:hypothetical protein
MACWWVLVHCDPILYGFIKSIGTGFSSNFELFEDDTTSHAQRFFNFFSIRSFGFGYISSIGTGFSSNFELFEDDTTSHARWFSNFFTIRSFGFGYISSIGTGLGSNFHYVKTTPVVLVSSFLLFDQKKLGVQA